MLTDTDRAVLHFEREWWKKPGAKESALRARFDMTPTAYYTRLNALLDDPDALEADPLLVNRLRRERDRKAALRRGVRL